MSAIESFTLAYLLNSLWQVPLVFAAAWIVTRALRRSGPAIEHRIWVAALGLEALLPACSISPVRIFAILSRLFFWSFIHHDANAHAHVTIIGGPAYARDQLSLPPHLLSVIVLVYAGTLTWLAARLLWGVWKTGVLHRRARRLVLTGHSREIWARCCTLFAVHDAELATSAEVACPMTIGVLRRIVLLPANLPACLRDDDLDAAIAHEFAHMRRRDFAKNLAYAMLSLPVAYHPLLWLTRTRLEETREMLCDAMAAQALAGSQSYARSLLRLASLFAHRSPGTILHAIGIFDANIFERRIMNLTEKHTEVRGLRRFVTAAACVILGLATCTSAMALRMKVAAPLSDSGNKAVSPRISTSVPTRPILILSKDPEFPVKARAEKVKFDGTVVVALVVSRNGVPKHVAIKKSLRADFDRSAIEAVRQYRFKPALLDGKPVDCPLYIDVNFQLF